MVLSFVNQGPSGLARLRELLPMMFDSHRIFTTEGQMRLLRDCSLQPLLQTDPFHQVTFVLPEGWEEALSTSSPSPRRESRRRRARPASETSRPS
jgi:hypothetical protein